MTPIDRDRLLDLLAEWDELRDRGESTGPEELCPDDPLMQSALRDRIAQRLKVERLIEPAASSSHDSRSRVFARTHEPDTGDREARSTEVPERIGRHRVERLLGSGGFGQVFLAYDDELKRYVAIKVPHAELVKQPEQAEAYKREARSVASLDHPHIVPVYDVGSTERYPCFVVSKYIPGTNLFARMNQSRLPFSEAARVIATVADALHYAHTQGLVHRDVKPVNILLSTAGEPFVVDFGLALRERDPKDERRFAGTPAYMSPEQARGEAHRVDGRSDVFSLGVVFYELLVQRKPFQGVTSSELLAQITSVDPKPPRQMDDRIPKELERICLRALAKRASHRYRTARDFANDLRQFLFDSQTPTTDTPSRGLNSGAANSDDGGLAGVERRSNPFSPGRTSGVGTMAEGSSAPKIVPRGLRSFDEHDAEFYLQLLPGPRDRDGLPDSIRFWMTRIEERDANKTFAIGMIYGPSGCGKSSLVKAGLLPRLAEDVTAIYLEATDEMTESRLLKGLRRRLPGLPDGLSLPQTLAALRQGRGMTSGGKVLLVLDQFEQWLHARQSLEEQSNSELVEALRQCDGEHLQCLVMVRDDFWMAATRFARELEIPLVDGLSMNAVDLFPIRHARQVLIEFGRAFGCVEDRPAGIDSDTASFVDRAVGDLAENGLVVPVRLVIFAEMLKERPWVPATLKHVGGIKGVGVTFLEATFSGTNAPASHRFHQRAARDVLKALLPEAGTDIKGHFRTYAELLKASSYDNRISDFEDLLRILNRELRLVTMTDPFGVPDDDASIPSPGTDRQCFQLTHDYLVPSLRDWLTRKQKETYRGRAELQLEDRAALWHTRPDNRLLPTLIEFFGIRLFADSKGWTRAQRQMMTTAGRRHAVRWGGLLTAVLLFAFGIQQYLSHRTKQHVKTAVDSILTSTSASVPIAMRDLLPLPKELVERELRSQVAGSDETRRLRLAYALSELGDVDLLLLVARIETASADETDNLIVALGHSQKKSIEAVRANVLKCERDSNWRFKARLALVALYLGDANVAANMCQIDDRPDPIQRSTFIEGFCGWHGDVLKLVEFAQQTEDAGLRSALCMGLAGMPSHKLTDEAKAAWQPVFTKWFQTANDSVTHSTAGLTMLYWRLRIAATDSMMNPSEARDWYINSIGIPMLTIPPKPSVSRVRLDDASNDPPSFLVSDREITMANFGTFLTDPDYPRVDKPNPPQAFSSVLPVVPAHQTSWSDAVLFCNWLSLKEGFSPCYERPGVKEGFDSDQWLLIDDANGYRIPSVSQWEFACRAGTTTPYSCGDASFQHRFANLNGPVLEPCAIRFPNGWGLFDMQGNVQEWCNDAFPDGNGRERKVRGGPFGLERFEGSFHDNWTLGMSSRVDRVGFRVARIPSTSEVRSSSW